MITSDDFAQQFREACQLWRLHFERNLVVTGQTITKGRALLYLADTKDNITQKQLAQLLSIEEPSVVRMLDGLEKCGLVERKFAPHDGRMKHVYLTAAAMPVVAQVQTIAHEAYVTALAGIPADKLAVACEVLAMITQNVS